MIRALILILGLSFVAVPAAAEAQETGKRAAAKSRNKAGSKQTPKSKRTTKTGGKSKSAPAAAAAPAPDKAVPPARERAEEPAPASGDAAALSTDAEENVRKEGGGEIKTVEFGGLDIEGQLKTPQMLYFLNRLRAEFNRPELPHRTFIPELQRGTKEGAF